MKFGTTIKISHLHEHLGDVEQSNYTCMINLMVMTPPYLVQSMMLRFTWPAF
jgi:hypothetical protein